MYQIDITRILRVYLHKFLLMLLLSQMKRLGLILSGFLLIISLMVPIAVLAESDATSAPKLRAVYSIANSRERLWEKITLFFKFSAKDKINYQKELTEKRLAELQYAIENEKGNILEDLTSRYSTYLGNLTEMVVKNKMSNRKQEFMDAYAGYYRVLDELDTRFESNSGFWLLMEHDKNYTKIYSDQIKGM